MPKITITIEDLPGDKVKIVADPPLSDIMKIAKNRRSEMTSAHGYAMNMLISAKVRSDELAKEPAVLTPGQRVRNLILGRKKPN